MSTTTASLTIQRNENKWRVRSALAKQEKGWEIVAYLKLPKEKRNLFLKDKTLQDRLIRLFWSMREHVSADPRLRPLLSALADAFTETDTNDMVV